MSDDFLKIVPENPKFIPDPSTQARAASLLVSLLPDAESCEAKVFETLRFIDAGANHEAIICPACGIRTALDFFTENDPGMHWWYGVQDSMKTTPLDRLQTALPCCNTAVPFTSVTFDSPAAFAQFELSVLNPYIYRPLNESEIGKIEKVLGCKVKQIWAHY